MPQKLEDLFTADEIESMSDEERQAFQEELEHETSDDDDPEGGTGDEKAGEAAEEEEEKETEAKAGDDADSDDGAKDDAGDSKEPPADDDDKEVKTDDIPEDEPAKQSEQAPEKQPEQEAEKERDKAVQDEVAQKKEELQGDLKKLRQKFEEGEVVFEDYMEQWFDVKTQINNIENKALQAQEQVEVQWQADQQAFFSGNKDIAGDGDARKVFAQQVNIKLSTPEGQAMSNQELLEKSAKEARAIMGISSPAKEQDTGGEDARRKANQAAGQKTAANLSDAPNASEQETDGSAFSRLDRLLKKGGDELESAVEKMTPEQQEEWARDNK